MSTNQYKEMKLNELEDELLKLRKEQFNLRLKKANGTLDKTHVVRQLRRNIARVKTYMTQKAGNKND